MDGQHHAIYGGFSVFCLKKNETTKNLHNRQNKMSELFNAAFLLVSKFKVIQILLNDAHGQVKKVYNEYNKGI